VKVIKNNVSIDYLKASFTLPELEDGIGLYKIDFYVYLLEILGFQVNEGVMSDKGLNGFRSRIELGEYILILLNGPQNKTGLPTNMLEMKGSACREFDKRNGDWAILLDFLLMFNCNFTRIDICNDIIEDEPGVHYLFDLNILWNKISTYEFHSRGFAKRTLFDSARTKDGTTLGKTITFGTRSSECVLQIYDKKAERTVVAKEEVWANSWIRFEIRYMQSKANQFVLRYAKQDFKDLQLLFSGLLSELLEFKEPSDYKLRHPTAIVQRRDVWETCPWWNEHLGNVKRIKIQNQHSLETTLITNMKWMRRSVSKALSRIAAADPDNFFNFIYDLINIKKDNIETKDIYMINDFRKIMGMKKYSDEEVLNEIDKISNSIKNMKEK